MATLKPRDQDRIWFLLATGLRRTEFVSLRWQAVNLVDRVLTVPRSKSGRTRHVPLNTTAVAVLRGLPRSLDRRALGFANAVGKPDWHWYDKTLPKAFRRAGLADVTRHALRHTFATRLVATGTDLRTVQELGGWASLAMVQRHVAKGRLHEAVERLSAPRSATGSATSVSGWGRASIIARRRSRRSG